MRSVSINHRSVTVGGSPVHVAEAGDPDAPASLFLHGWPESWQAFERMLYLLGDSAHALAIDLPGIGESPVPARTNDKRTLATYVHELIRQLGLESVTLAGHDIGAQIAYAYLRKYPGDLARAVLMNIVIPGVDPWSEVVRNRHVWHFAFHAVPELPELLVSDHVREYFDYFYDILSARRDGVPPSAREAYARAYSRPEALRTGFGWYREFDRDEKDNSEDVRTVQTPVLYVRGHEEPGEVARYVRGLRAVGLQNVSGRSIPGSGHFVPDEQPEELAKIVAEFMRFQRITTDGHRARAWT
jgi:pimeloyl-ACP methyl ester carboxylesterase